MIDLDNILKKIENPSRYIGGEINSVQKEVTDEMVRFAFAFPDIYEIGMSYLGMRILYHLKNRREDVYCERVFSPWVDMEEEMRKNEMELFTLESKTPLKHMDFIGFTLQYELSYTNILNMLDLSNIPFKSADRDEQYPIIMAGGPNAYNPEPLAEIIDLFVIGEGEEVNLELIDLYKEHQKDFNKDKFLFEASQIDGIYVPSLYEVTYNADHTIQSFVPKKEGVKTKVTKRIIREYDQSFFPEKIIVPFQKIVHDRITTEIFRGCTKGCRFCQAGMLYRPIRERSSENILEIIDMLIRSTGYEEVSLSSLSTLDHSEIKTIVETFIEKYGDKKIGISLPSLRLDSKSISLLKEIQKVRKTGLTFAPEAGSQRMRDVINKNVTEEDLYSTLTEAFSNGWNRVKLYFMLGLPTETKDDIEAIARLANGSVEAFYYVDKEKRRGYPTITVSTSNFIPKPFTPFQWEPQDSIKMMNDKHDLLNMAINNKRIKYNYHDSYTSYLEGIIARGDRRLNDVLIKAYELGCKFDTWGQFFKFDQWMEAFKILPFDKKFYNTRRRAYEEILPWDHIDAGVSKEYLKDENEKSKKGIKTKDCREGCTGCNVNASIVGGDCFA